MRTLLAPDAADNGEKFTKNVDVELWRFLGITIIMIFHFYQTGIPYGSYHFASGWMFTDLFFYITGYYTFKHFFEQEKEKDGLENIGIQRAIHYTIERYRKYFPYVLCSTGVMYALTIFYKLEMGGGYDLRSIVYQLVSIILELFCLTSAVPYGYENNIPAVPLDAPLWFISAMLCVLPIFCCLCRHRRNGVLDIALFSLFIKGLSVSTERTNIADLTRALCGLSVGAVLYLVGTTVFHEAGPGKKYVLLGHIILLIVTALTYCNEQNYILVRLLMIVGLFCIQQDHKCYWGKRGARCICWLGSLSLPLFVWHWPVASFMKCWLTSEMPTGQRMAVYIVSSFMMALLFYGIKVMISRRKGAEG